jgi:two-component system, NtrC family, response regulator
MARLLIIDDDPMFCSMLAQAVAEVGHESILAHTLSVGIRLAGSEAVDAILLDVRLPDGNGLELIASLRDVASKPEVIIITGEGDPDGAELAIKNGAWDYIEKPSSLSKMLLPVTRALEYRSTRQRKEKPLLVRRERIIGRSHQVIRCIEFLADAACDDASVVITGPTGTGKEVFALTLHENSSRAQERFVVVDCAALPENLVESALFGHRRGAFTGADRDQPGLIQQADGGTLFLDEVGEMPLSIQKSFLRVLQERRYRPLGSTVELTSNFRVIAATNRDLEEMIRQGSFRDDLYYRLRTHHISLPALREREGDVEELALWFIQRFCKDQGITPKGIDKEFMDLLELYPWPGNVRELKNSLGMALQAARFEPVLHSAHLPLEIRIWLARNSLTRNHEHKRASRILADWKSEKEQALHSSENRYFADLYMATSGDVGRMAEISGLTKARIYGLIKKHALRMS